MTQDRATGRDIVLAIGENMRQSLEPLVTKIIAPSIYQVYLHAEDYDRLRSLFPELENEAKALLDKELERLNRGNRVDFSRFLPGKKTEPEPAGPKYVSAEGKWTVRFQEDPNASLNPGDVEVVSEFARPPEANLGVGSKTHRISTTRKFGGQPMTTRKDLVAEGGTISTGPDALARILYKDDRGTHTFLMTKDEIVIGRTAPDVWADLTLDTSLDVSREHARLQRTADGRFRLKDLSKLGTTLNGTPLPRSLEPADGGVRDLDRWVEVPEKARIGLAGVVYLDFERTSKA